MVAVDLLFIFLWSFGKYVLLLSWVIGTILITYCTVPTCHIVFDSIIHFPFVMIMIVVTMISIHFEFLFIWFLSVKINNIRFIWLLCWVVLVQLNEFVSWRPNCTWPTAACVWLPYISPLRCRLQCLIMSLWLLYCPLCCGSCPAYRLWSGIVVKVKMSGWNKSAGLAHSMKITYNNNKSKDC